MSGDEMRRTFAGSAACASGATAIPPANASAATMGGRGRPWLRAW
jgi:hypothetical protein